MKSHVCNKCQGMFVFESFFDHETCDVIYYMSCKNCSNTVYLHYQDDLWKKYHAPEIETKG